MLPPLRHCQLSERTSRRIRWQSQAILATIGVCCVLTYLRESMYEVPNETFSDNDVVLQLPTKEMSRQSEDTERRLAMSPYYYIDSNGKQISNLTLNDCTWKSGVVVSGTQVHEEGWDAPCAGLCRTFPVQEEIDKLGSEFLLVNTNVLENPEKPRLKAGKKAWVIWYTLQIVYMFCALAIACDEFFVPALECFVDEFGISMDVAGATFMAAGGSMPELFTSFIATFKESEVGFAAIVGSAVFNVLFVIAVCAIASKEVLVLTWWPLARDCSFYLIALVGVVIVFADNVVHWYEALALFCFYLLYCTFMNFNGRIHRWVEAKLSGTEVQSLTDEEAKKAENSTDVNMKKPGSFRMGILHLLTNKRSFADTAGIAAVTQIAGDLRETFEKLDIDNDKFLDMSEMQALLTAIDPKIKYDSNEVKTAMRRLATVGNGDKINFEDFKRWYLRSEVRISSEVHRIFAEFDKNRDQKLNKEEIMKVMKSLKHEIDDKDVEEAIKEMSKMDEEDEQKEAKEGTEATEVQELKKEGENEATDKATNQAEPSKISDKKENASDPKDVQITEAQFEKWYKKSIYHREKMDAGDAEADAEGACVSLEMPDTGPGYLRDYLTFGMFWWVFTYPLVCVMYCTLPDVKHPKWKGKDSVWAVGLLEFALSLVWIGIFSLWLYECIVVVSNTIGLPVAVSAVTVLAGGTSIPDLISSYVVAVKGEGDMAVSSSIGSNIFDVTVGLPLPWLCYTIAKWKAFDAIQNKTLVVDILVLVVMILCVIGTVMAMKWKMTKCMGYVMLLLYVFFLVQNLIGQLPEGDPVVDYTKVR